MNADEIEVLIRVVKDAGDHGRPHGIGPVTLLQILTQLRDEHLTLVAIADSPSEDGDELSDMAWAVVWPGQDRRDVHVDVEAAP